MRGYIDSALAGSDSPEVLDRAIGLSLSLWRLERTNHVDVGRALRLAEKWGAGGRVLGALGTSDGRVSAEDRGLWLWLMADEGDWERVEQMRPSPGNGSGLEVLVACAVRAIRGGGSDRAAAVLNLTRAGMATDSQSVAANRLSVQVGERLRDLKWVQESSQRLKEAGAARFIDLLRAGRAEFAIGGTVTVRAEARKWGHPKREREVEPWVDFLDSMGMHDWARAELEWAAGEWGRRDWWLRCIEWTIRDREFSALARLGNGLVSGMGPLRDWRSLGHGLLAISAAEFNRTEEAEAAWRKSEASMVPTQGWGLRWCEMFSRLGHLRSAAGWLIRIEPEEAGSLDYWKLRRLLAREEGDWDGMLTALKKSRVLAPGDVALMSEHASVLLVLRQEPEEALRLLETDAVLARRDRRDRLWMALALAQMGRLTEARRLLDSMVTGGGSAGDDALIQLAAFEVHLRSGRNMEAEKEYERTDLKRLPAPLARWMESAYQGLKPLRRKSGP
jgi:hypothetical protein